MAGKKGPEAEDVGATEEVIAAENEENRKGQGDDDFGVNDGNLGGIFDDALPNFLGIEGTDGAHGS